MAEGKRFLSAQDIADMMECSKSKAYTIIRQLNEELILMWKNVNAVHIEKAVTKKEAKRKVIPRL